MPAYLTFFPLGNADTTLIRLANDDLVLMDYANMRSTTDPADKRIDLPEALRDELYDAQRASFRVVAFTHLDDDHICGARDFSGSIMQRVCKSEDRVKLMSSGSQPQRSPSLDLMAMRLQYEQKLVIV